MQYLQTPPGSGLARSMAEPYRTGPGSLDPSVAAIAIGSNLSSIFGAREQNLLVAIDRLRALGTVRAISTFLETAPVGFVEQPHFLNGALLLETLLPPAELLHALLAIEHSMGRTRQDVPTKGPRIIDLDLLFFAQGPYRDLVLSSPELTLPHPAIAGRLFVLTPLVEIAPAWTHPLTGKTVQLMLRHLQS